MPIASPVILRMRSKILRSLGEQVRPNLQEVASVVGYALGRAVKWVREQVGDSWPGNGRTVQPETAGR